jgi:hypothetical protein
MSLARTSRSFTGRQPSTRVPGLRANPKAQRGKKPQPRSNCVCNEKLRKQTPPRSGTMSVSRMRRTFDTVVRNSPWRLHAQSLKRMWTGGERFGAICGHSWKPSDLERDNTRKALADGLSRLSSIYASLGLSRSFGHTSAGQEHLRKAPAFSLVGTAPGMAKEYFDRFFVLKTQKVLVVRRPRTIGNRDCSRRSRFTAGAVLVNLGQLLVHLLYERGTHF